MKVSINLDEQAMLRWPLASLRQHAALCAQVLEKREASAKLARKQEEARKLKGFWHTVRKRQRFLDTGLMWAGHCLTKELARLPKEQRDPEKERFLDLPVRFERGENCFCKAAEILALRTCDKTLREFEAKHGVAVRVFSVEGNKTGLYHGKDRAALRVDLMPEREPDIDASLEAMEPMLYWTVVTNFEELLKLHGYS